MTIIHCPWLMSHGSLASNSCKGRNYDISHNTCTVDICLACNCYHLHNKFVKFGKQIIHVSPQWIRYIDYNKVEHILWTIIYGPYYTVHIMPTILVLKWKLRIDNTKFHLFRFNVYKRYSSIKQCEQIQHGFG